MSGYQPDLEVLEAMLAKADDKIRVARNSFDDEFYDDAASRAYYAAFFAVTAVLAHHGLTFSSHGKVLGAFNKELIKPGLFPADTAQKLERLFKDRQIGDYDAEHSIEREEAEQDIADAELILDACRRYLEQKTGHKFPPS
jgi:uncharacterized protein (UPF0332 family)